ncbi:MAG: hypothetical protein IPG22_20425 [Acidobacteria bacterium]|nr:hypothetical protein [Acidobacteriota bacterium]
MSDKSERWNSRAAVAFCVRVTDERKLTYAKYLEAKEKAAGRRPDYRR